MYTADVHVDDDDDDDFKRENNNQLLFLLLLLFYTYSKICFCWICQMINILFFCKVIIFDFINRMFKTFICAFYSLYGKF